MTAQDPKKRKRNIAHDVREKLLALLDEEAFAPGSVLPSEREMMALFDVGRPAVREATQSLQVMGLVEIRKGERAKVVEPSIDRAIEHFGGTMRRLLVKSSADLEHLKSARLTFEKAMAIDAARMRTTADINRMRRIVEAQDAARKDQALFLGHDRDFHRAIAAISGNPIYTTLADAIFGWLTDFHTDIVLHPGCDDMTIDEHSAIVDAIESGNSTRAAKAMHDHMIRASTLYQRTNLGTGKAK